MFVARVSFWCQVAFMIICSFKSRVHMRTGWSPAPGIEQTVYGHAILISFLLGIIMLIASANEADHGRLRKWKFVALSVVSLSMIFITYMATATMGMLARE
jgi:NADH:ubiquinone oxidoreductase subunit 6 (subunit J)